MDKIVSTRLREYGVLIEGVLCLMNSAEDSSNSDNPRHSYNNALFFIGEYEKRIRGEDDNTTTHRNLVNFLRQVVQEKFYQISEAQTQWKDLQQKLLEDWILEVMF